MVPITRSSKHWPDVNLEAVGHQELDGVYMPTHVQCRVALWVSGQQISTKLMQQRADLHVSPSGSQMQSGPSAAVPGVWVKSGLQEPFSVSEIPVDAGLQQWHGGLQGVVDEDVGHFAPDIWDLEIKITFVTYLEQLTWHNTMLYLKTTLKLLF